MPNGIAYGFVGLQEVFDRRVQVYGEGLVLTALIESAAEWTRMLNATLAGWVERTTRARDLVLQAGGGYFQPLDALGNPMPTRPGAKVQVGYPLQGGGDAWGQDRVTRAYLTVAEANQRTIDALGKDARTLRHRFLVALLGNTGWTFTDERMRDGAIPVVPLANGDAQTYVLNGGAVSTDNHYLAQAADISDLANPFPGIREELVEHPGNGQDVICYVSTSLVTSIMGLTDFIQVADPKLQMAITATQIAPGGVTEAVRGIGDVVWGRVNGCWIVEMKAMPAGYIIAKAENGGAVLAMREHDAPALQGLILEQPRGETNLDEVRIIRYAGFGVQRRMGALAMQIGNGSYTVPTGFDAPSVI
jgi:hypothetical protein